jgi:hypothetical protein
MTGGVHLSETAGAARGWAALGGRPRWAVARRGWRLGHVGSRQACKVARLKVKGAAVDFFDFGLKQKRARIGRKEIDKREGFLF